MLLRYPNILKIYKTPCPYLKHSFDIIGISEHKIIKDPKNSAFNLLVYTFCFNETETSHGGTVFFFVSNNLTYKLRPGLLINEHGRLEPTVIELNSPNKKYYYLWYYS